MSTIICNSGPLIALGGIGQLELLRSLFGTVSIPAEVAVECQAGGVSKTGLQAFQKASWLRIVDLGTTPDPLLTSLLDLGESRAIELALRDQPSVLLMDEARGRRVARDIYGLKVVGTGRLLVEAKQMGAVTAVKPLIESIRENGYWLSDRIVNEILKQAGE
jgi:predicted nucleic acid-binding protein